MKNLIGFLTIIIILLPFQNCANEVTEVSKLDVSSGNAFDPAKVTVSPTAKPRSDSISTQLAPSRSSYAALPLAIDFSINPSSDPLDTLWGWWIHNWLSLDAELIGLLGPPRYYLRLDLFKNTVTEFASHQIIYELKPHEVQELTNTLTGALLSAPLAAPSISNCAATKPQEYATLETDYGLFDLSDGSCYSLDLYHNNGSGTKTGLNQFLSNLRSALATVSL